MHRYGNTALQPYYFRKNLQGDVTAIYDADGTKIGEYTYDAWGNCDITYGINTDVVRNNPIRYRSYYFDRETSIYYLNARYYDPALRRFLSLDSTEYLDPETPNGLNLYAYCNNDPMNYADPSGNSAILALALMGLGVGLGLGYAAYTDYQDNSAVDGSVGWQTYFGAAVTLGAIGFGAGYFWPAISSFLGSSFTFTLPSLGYANASGALAASMSITLTGAQIAESALIGASIIGLNYLAYESKKAAPRIRSNTKKGAYDKAFYKGGKKAPIYHPNGKFGPHYHPANPKFKHWHYYFTFLFGLLGIELENTN